MYCNIIYLYIICKYVKKSRLDIYKLKVKKNINDLIKYKYLFIFGLIYNYINYFTTLYYIKVIVYFC